MEGIKQLLAKTSLTQGAIQTNIVKAQDYKKELNDNFKIILEAIRKFCPEYVVDENNKQALMEITVWASRLECEEYSNIDLNKGLFFFGEKGTGKSKAMEGLRYCLKSGNLAFRINKSEDIADHASSGNDLDYYVENSENYINKPYNLCIDDLGFERLMVKYYGNEICPAAYVISRRYDLFQKRFILTHITSNLNGDEIERFYGDRIRDRLRELCNQITFLGGTRRK